MTSRRPAARPIRAVLDECVERIAPVDPAEQLAALKRILKRVPDLEAGLGAARKGLTSGRKLADAMASDDPGKRALALLVLTELEPGQVGPLFDEIEALYKAESAKAVERCLRALPEAVVSALAKGRRGVPARGPAARAALVRRYDMQLHYAICDQLSKLDDEAEGKRLLELLKAPAEISTPAWVVTAGLRSDAEERALGWPAFLARVRANQLSWETTTQLAAREEVSSTAGRLALLTTVASEVTGYDMDCVVKWLIEKLADVKDERVDVVLAKILAEHPDLERGVCAAEALAGRKSGVARAALLARLAASAKGKAGEREVDYAFLAARGLVQMNPAELGSLARFLTPAAVGGPVGNAVARAALMVVSGLPEKTRAPVLGAWAAVAAPLLGGPLDGPARELLNHVPEAKLRALLPPPPKRARVAARKNPRWLERYEAGEHAAVWREMRERGDLADDEAVRVTELTMRGVKRELERIVAALRQLEYPFAEEPLPGPRRSDAKDLAAMEKALGAPLPMAFRAFHAIVGAVDLRRDHSAGVISRLGDLQWSDPLQIAPAHITRDFLSSALKASKRKWVEALRPPARLMIAMSPSRKGHPDQEDDGWYELDVVGHPIDGVVSLQGKVVGSFVDFLRATLRSGGFSALGRPGNSAAPRAKLTAGHVAF